MSNDEDDQVGIEKPGGQLAELKALFEATERKVESMKRIALARRQAENQRRISIGAEPEPIPGWLKETERRQGQGKAE